MLLILESTNKEAAPQPAESELRKSIRSMIWALGLTVYFVLSFLTQACHLTWLVFPMIEAAQGLVKAILDLKEAAKQ